MTQIETAFLYALTLYGTSADADQEQHAKINDFLIDAGFPQEDIDNPPWCAAFLNAVLHRSGLPVTNSLAAESFLQWGEPTTIPMLGDVVVFQWTKNIGGGHHVGFVCAVYPTIVYVLGGNEDGMVEIKGYDPKYVMQYRRLEK